MAASATTPTTAPTTISAVWCAHAGSERVRLRPPQHRRPYVLEGRRNPEPVRLQRFLLCGLKGTSATALHRARTARIRTAPRSIQSLGAAFSGQAAECRWFGKPTLRHQGSSIATYGRLTPGS